MASVAQSSPHITKSKALPNAAIIKKASSKPVNASWPGSARMTKQTPVPTVHRSAATPNMRPRSMNEPTRGAMIAAIANPIEVNSSVHTLGLTPRNERSGGTTIVVQSTSIHQACQNPIPSSRNENGESPVSVFSALPTPMKLPSFTHRHSILHAGDSSPSHV